MSDSDLVSIVTLTHNKLEVTRTCLPSLLGGDFRPWELVVVDNGSTDGTRAWLEAFRGAAAKQGVEVSVLLNPGNIGCSTARNQGLAKARGGRVVFMDNDVALRSRGWLRRLRSVLDADAGAGLVGPKLVYPYEPFAIQCAGVGIARSGRVQFRGRGDPKDDPRYGVRQDVQCLISACFMGRTDVLRAAGGFDEAFNPVEYEDFDLCYRLRRKGLRMIYEPAVEMYHFESVTTAGTAALPNTYLIIKHGLQFKDRWRAIFEKEDGPPDSETAWRRIPARPLASIGALAVVD
jgi:O-antigen biosynthesis protein